MATSREPDAFDLSAGVPKIEGALRPTPKFADRISKRVLAVVFLIVGVIVAIFLLSLDNMDKKKSPQLENEIQKNKSAASTDAVVGVPKELLGATNAEVGEKMPPNLVKPSVASPSESFPTELNLGKKVGVNDIPAISKASDGAIPKDVAGGVVVPPLTPAQQAANVERRARLGRMSQARLTGLSSKPFDAEGDAPASGAAGASAKIAELLGAAAKNPGMSGQALWGAKSDSEQDEKLDFVKNAGKDDRGYHPHVSMAALSPNEVKTGAFIPMALEQGINSDLPGQITARVTEAVYDTISGCRLLIPAMSKVIGKYDSKVSLGQGRMLVVWNSIIFPDGAELNLAGMQGYDTGGRAGLESDVDNHYLRLVGLTFGMSMITAGAQLSVPQPNPGVNGSSAAATPAQTVATALAQQYGQLGAQILGKYMSIQPTLRNYAGERFVVMVPHTIVFSKVWRNRCTAR